MAETGEKVNSLQLNRFEMKRLAWALALSLAAHFLVWGGYELGKKYHLWQRWHWPEKLQLSKVYAGHHPDNRASEKILRFFADQAAKKWPLRGSLKLG